MAKLRGSTFFFASRAFYDSVSEGWTCLISLSSPPNPPTIWAFWSDQAFFGAKKMTFFFLQYKRLLIVRSKSYLSPSPSEKEESSFSAPCF
jgi:hypothetical protein